MQGIYCIKNVINNKMYIGSSTNIEKRFKQHIDQLVKEYHHSYKLQNDYYKYGKDVFICEVLEIVDDKDNLLIIEQKYIDLYKSYETGYNILKNANGKDYLNKENINIIHNDYDFNLLLNLLTFDSKLHYASITLAVYLTQFIDYNTNYLMLNNKPLKNKHILDDIIMNKSDFYRCIKILKQKKIIIEIEEDKTKYYMFNPFIACKGKRIDKTTLHIFEDTIYNN